MGLLGDVSWGQLGGPFNLIGCQGMSECAHKATISWQHICLEVTNTLIIFYFFHRLDYVWLLRNYLGYNFINTEIYKLIYENSYPLVCTEIWQKYAKMIASYICGKYLFFKKKTITGTKSHVHRWAEKSCQHGPSIHQSINSWSGRLWLKYGEYLNF